MRVALMLLLMAGVCGCSGSPTAHESHRNAIDGERIDYPYWETYLRQHGDAETVAHFEGIIAAVSNDQQSALRSSFERFCRFQGCLEGYREVTQAKP